MVMPLVLRERAAQRAGGRVDESSCSSGLASTGSQTGGIDLVWSAPAVWTGAAVTGCLVYRNDGDGAAGLSTLACDGTGSVDTACSVVGFRVGRSMCSR